MKYIPTFAGLFLHVLLAGQSPRFERYDWNTLPQRVESDTVQPVNGAVILLDRRIKEVYVNSEDLFEEISVYHRKIRITSDDAINRFNKIYVPVNQVIEVIAMKARFISPQGRITELSQSSIFNVENLENQGDYNTFAIEGAEVGGEIEYYYVLRTRFDPYGSVTIQGNVPVSRAEFRLVHPSRLGYLVKSYHGFPPFESYTDTTTGSISLTALSGYVPALHEEEYAHYQASLQRIEYTLAYNRYQNITRVYSFASIGEVIYQSLFVLTKPEKKVVDRLVRQWKLEERDVTGQVRQIENRVKTEIAISEELTGTTPIDETYAKKQTSKSGATKLTIALFNALGIEFELIAACDRQTKVFDPEFNGYNFLNDYLIYVTETGKCMVPDNPAFRMGYFPSGYQGQFGLFMHPLKYREHATLAYEIKSMPVDSYSINFDSLHVSLRFNEDGVSLDARVRRLIGGEIAGLYQSFWPLANEDMKHEQVASLFSMGSEHNAINSYSVRNGTPDDMAVRPMEWNVNVTVNSLVSLAGDDIVIQIGEAIGEQSQLYQTTTRVMPIQTNTVHNYYRKIEFVIPGGYEARNLQTLNMNVEMMANGKASCAFRSWYHLNGNVMTVFSEEFYSELEYPAEQFESFRRVINAAADFNKRTILLSKL